MKDIMNRKSNNNNNNMIIQRISAELERHHHVSQSSRQIGGAPVPPLCRAMIRSLPGNTTCVDCNGNAASHNPEWAALSYGALICMSCAGRHRSYGVHISTVRSLDMDHFQTTEILQMLEGGNTQLQSFFERHDMGASMTMTTASKSNSSSSSSRNRYHTKAAKFYRTQMTQHVARLAAQGRYQGREASRKQYNKNSTRTTTTSTTKRRTSSSETTAATTTNARHHHANNAPRRHDHHQDDPCLEKTLSLRRMVSAQ